jgi:hypothetical protein
MRNFVFSSAAVILGLTLVSTVEAGNGRNSGGTSSSHSVSNSSNSFRFSTVRSTQNYSTKIHTMSTSFQKFDSHNFKDYNLKYGKKFGNGWCYPNRFDCHWSYRCWCPYYSCWYYYDPCCLSYYYWCGTHSCYYPISYIVTAPPVAGEVIIEVNAKISEVPAPASVNGPVVTQGPTK